MNEETLIVVIEETEHGSYSCFYPLPYCGLIGLGDTIEECKEDFLVSIEEVNEMAQEENITLPHYNIEWKIAS